MTKNSKSRADPTHVVHKLSRQKDKHTWCISYEARGVQHTSCISYRARSDEHTSCISYGHLFFEMAYFEKKRKKMSGLADQLFSMDGYASTVALLDAAGTGKSLLINASFPKYYASKIATHIDLDRADEFESIKVWHSSLADDAGVRIAQLVERSGTITSLSLVGNKELTERTMHAIARALAVNTSLDHLVILGHSRVSALAVRAAMLCALRLNPLRSPDTRWIIADRYGNSHDDNVYPHLKATVDRAGHPTLLFLLAHHEPPPFRSPASRRPALASQ